MERAALLLLLLQAALLHAAHADCPPGHLPCTVRTVRLPWQLCLPPLYACDGHDDCMGGTDEQGCRGRCKAGARECDGRCLRAAYWCDGLKDCDDNQDEANCSAGLSTELRPCPAQPETQLWLRDRQLFCDGRNDCPLGYDERDCDSEEDCKAGSYFCLNAMGSGRCMHPKTRCNGVQDCRDNTDEEDCPSASRSQSLPTFPAAPAPPPDTTTTTETPTTTLPLEFPLIFLEQGGLPKPESDEPPKLPSPSPLVGTGSDFGNFMLIFFAILLKLAIAIACRICFCGGGLPCSSGVNRAPSFVYVESRRAVVSPPPDYYRHIDDERRLVDVPEEPTTEEAVDEYQGKDLGLRQVVASTAPGAEPLVIEQKRH